MSESTQLTPRQAVLKTEERFLKSMPATMNFEAETGFAIQLLSNNTYLESVAQNNIASFQQAITNVAAIGLSLNPAEKLAYLLPRNVKIGKDGNRNVYESRVFLEPSYMGLMKLATDSGSIKWVQAAMVRESDSFTDNGAGNAPDHVYSPFAKPSERGGYVGAYCVAKTADGDYLTTIMTLEELENIKSRSESAKKNYGPWITDYAEQCKKTVVRRAFKMWPRSTGMERLAAAVDISNQNEGFEPINNVYDFPQASPEQHEHVNELLKNDDALGFFVFWQTTHSTAIQDIVNTAPKGQITSRKALIRDMDNKGSQLYLEWKTELENSVGDSSVVIDFIENHAQDVIDFVRDHLNPEAQSFFNEVQASI